ncbi:MAG: thioredoxin family protein, partial [Phycisphaeraceae bacterium]|nr:thioredoxin family protein [Phycisphaeraceae bacterium]
MSLTPSNMMELGTEAPDFELPEVEGGTVSLDDYPDAQAYLVMFICRHCPFVKHLEDELAAIGRDYADKGVAIFAISSNDVENYPDDAPDKLAEQKQRVGFNFPYLYDEDQSVAKAYDAACTPDFFLFDGDRKLVYRGQLDDT